MTAYEEYLDDVRSTLGRRTGRGRSSALFSSVREVRKTVNPDEMGIRLTAATGENVKQAMNSVLSGVRDVNRENWRTKLRTFVESQGFQILAGIMILANTILVGVETQYQAETGKIDASLRDLLLVLNVWYMMEVLLRLVAFQLEFFTHEESRAWNMFDLVLAVMSLVDVFMEMGLGKGSLARLLRMLRVARILRSIRLVRWLRHMREFRKMIFALLVSVQTLLWAVVLLLFLMYTFAIWFTSTVSEFIRESGGRENNEELYSYFGSMWYSLYSLWLSISGGINWYYIVTPLFESNPALAMLFIGYISITVLGVMNIVTSVFVESAMRSTQHYRDLLVQEKARNKEMYGKHLRQIFRQIDADMSGMINMEELRQFLQDESLQLTAYFEALDIDAEDAKALFTLLDRDGSGEIDVDEFCDGCFRLKGEAKSFDINCLLYNSKRLENKLCTVLEGMVLIMEGIEQTVAGSCAPGSRRQTSQAGNMSRKSLARQIQAIAEEPAPAQLQPAVGQRHHRGSPSTRVSKAHDKASTPDVNESIQAGNVDYLDSSGECLLQSETRCERV